MSTDLPLDAMTPDEKRSLLAQLLAHRSDRPLVAPLSLPQERLWFLDKLNPGLPTYNIPASFPLSGPLHLDALERAIGEIVRRHETLRTTFVRREAEPVQLIWPHRTVPLTVRDLRRMSSYQRDREVHRLAGVEASEPFDLARGPLMRTVLVRLTDTESLLLVTIHHIVADGWSIAVFAHELTTLYTAFSAGQPSPLPPIEVHYRDFAGRQRREMQGDVLARHLDHWRRQLEGAPELLPLPTDHRRPATPSFRGWVQPFTLSREVAEALRALSRREGASPFMTLLAAFNVFLYRHTGQTDLIVGVPVANRTSPDVEPLIGFFVNTLIMRTDASGGPSFRRYLGRVREMALNAYAHDQLPFERIVEVLQPERDLSRNPVFQVVFTLQTTPHEAAEPGAEPPPELPLSESHTAKFDITLGMAEVGDHVTGALECSADLFEPATVTRLVDRFTALLSAIAADPDQSIDRLAVMDDDEREQVLVVWNRTAADFPDVCFHELFERQADATPDATAAEHGADTFTYRQLDERANQLAHHLVGRGARPEARVAVCVERGLDVAVAVLGVMKSGAAFVPLDPRTPPGRLDYVLDDAKAELVVTQPELADMFAGSELPLVVLGADGSATEGEPTVRPAVDVDPLNLAYLIYTSGSTGVPKGIMVPHRGLANMATSEVRDFGTGAGDRVLQVAPLIFDVSVWEMAMTWPAGATLVFATEEQIVEGSIINEAAITTAAFTPSLLATLDPERFPDLGTVLTVGEACTDRVVERWAPGRRLINIYGPTETTGHCTSIDLTVDTEVTIGRPIDNVSLYVLDNRLEPVPVGVPGELYVSSPGTTRGYAERPDLTAERYVPDPFSAESGGRLYATGDVVRHLADGRIEYLGRSDHQVKVRGFRIELGEIEAVATALPGVSDAAAVVREDHPGDRRLALYVVADEVGQLDADELRGGLRRSLPGYMVPAHVVVLDRLPLNSSNKVDRMALPPPEGVRVNGGAPAARPLTATEEVVAEIWHEVLHTPVGPDDNFFDLGGHSLLATQLLVRVHDALQVDLPIRQVFLGPTVADMARAVDAARAGGTDGPGGADGSGGFDEGTAPIRPAARRRHAASATAGADAVPAPRG